MKQIALPKSLLDLVPRPRTKWIIDATTQAARAGFVPHTTNYKGPNTTILLPDDLVAAIDTGRGSVARYIAAVVESASTTVTVEPAFPLPRTPQKQSKWQEAVTKRINIAMLDAALGRWARFFITGGSPAVDMERDDLDFSPEIASGIVFRSIIPQPYIGTEVDEWSREQRRNGKLVAWAYVDAESESMLDARDAEIREKLRAQGVEGLDEIERGEDLERQLLGSKTMYIELAKEDVKLLGDAAPAHLLKLAKKGEGQLFLGKPLDKVLPLSLNSYSDEKENRNRETAARASGETDCVL